MRVNGEGKDANILAQKIITISLPSEMLAKIDQAAVEEFANRSEFIRQAITDKLRTVDGYRARLAEMAANADMPTEDELFQIMRRRQGQRWYLNRDGEWRKKGDPGARM